MRLTASNLLRVISQLPKHRDYDYVNQRTKGKVRIVGTTEPEGPIRVKRFDPATGGTAKTAKTISLSTSMLRRYASAFSPGAPVNADRVFGGSYNTRSVLETLVAHTPEFYVCQPGRVEYAESSEEIKKGHKHLMWLPDEPHANGIIKHKKTELTISEIPSVEAIYEAIAIPSTALKGELGMSEEVKRRHSQIQIALVQIGRQLGFRTWVAKNDHGITYQGKRLSQMEGVIGRLEDEKLISAFDAAVKAALLIDCIWFKNGRLMPAVIEVEHSTGVTSGLTRMQRLQLILPPFPTRWVIAAPDEDRDRVMHECNRDQFRSLNAQYMPYSAVEELNHLCQRRKIQDVGERFIDSFMERTHPVQ